MSACSSGIAGLLLVLALAACGPADPPPTVLAASSLAGVVSEIAATVEPRSRCSFSSSGTAARQVAAGAPADLLVVAELEWLAVAGGRIGPGVVIAGNRLVLVVPADSELRVTLDGPPPQVARLALGDPAFVPLGRYAEEALRALGWWSPLEARLLPAMDARMALRLVASGEAELGVVYASDALASARVRVVAELPETLHRPIRYHAAVVDGSAVGQRLLLALRSPAAAAVLERHGLQAMLERDAEP